MPPAPRRSPPSWAAAPIPTTPRCSRPRSLDAASISTPETARHAPALAAAKKGLALMLEKPLGRSLADVDRLIADLRQVGGPAPEVNFILHAEPRFDRLKALVAEGALGNLVSIFARRRGTRAGIEKYAPWTDLLSSTLIHDIEMNAGHRPEPGRARLRRGGGARMRALRLPTTPSSERSASVRRRDCRPCWKRPGCCPCPSPPRWTRPSTSSATAAA